MKRVKDVMTTKARTCFPDDDCLKAAQIMKEDNVGFVPVLSDQEHKSLIGVLTDRDVCLGLAAQARDPRNVTVYECMSDMPVTCKTDDELSTALETMRKHRVRRLPAVDAKGNLQGVVSLADLAWKGDLPAEDLVDALKGMTEFSTVRRNNKGKGRRAA
jgi:CBS domain-containing protein